MFVESGIEFVGFLIQCISIEGADSGGLKVEIELSPSWNNLSFVRNWLLKIIMVD